MTIQECIDKWKRENARYIHTGCQDSPQALLIDWFIKDLEAIQEWERVKSARERYKEENYGVKE